MDNVDCVNKAPSVLTAKENTQNKVRYKSHDVTSCQTTTLRNQSVETCGSRLYCQMDAFHRPVTKTSDVDVPVSVKIQYSVSSLASATEQQSISTQAPIVRTGGDYSNRETVELPDMGSFPVIDEWKIQPAEGVGHTKETAGSNCARHIQKSFASAPRPAPVEQPVTHVSQPLPNSWSPRVIPSGAQHRFQGVHRQQGTHQRFAGGRAPLLPLPSHGMLQPSRDMMAGGWL